MKFIGVLEESKDQGLAFKIACPVCRQTQLWHLLEVKKRLAVFKLPFITCQSLHMIVCPVCKHYIDLTARMYRKLKMIARIRTDYFTRRIDGREYQQRMDRYFSNVFNELNAYLKQLAKNSMLPVASSSSSKITDDDIIGIFKSGFFCQGNKAASAHAAQDRVKTSPN